MKYVIFCVAVALVAIVFFYAVTLPANADTFVNGQRVSDAGTWLRVTDCNYVFQDKPYYVNSQGLATRLDQ